MIWPQLHSALQVASNKDGTWNEVLFWCYTDFYKWSIVHHHGKLALQLSVFSNTNFDVKKQQQYLFRTREAAKLATAIEYYIEKFISVMNIWLEGEEDEVDTRSEAGASHGAEEFHGAALRLDTDTEHYEEDLLGAYEESSYASPSPQPPASEDYFDGLDVRAPADSTITTGEFPMAQEFPVEEAASLIAQCEVDAPGTIFKSANICASVKKEEYRGSQARLTVDIKNVSANQAMLRNINARICLNGEDVIAESWRAELQTMPPSQLQAHETITLVIMAECMKPYFGCPAVLALSLATGVTTETAEERIPLVVSMLKFVEPVYMGEDVVASRWALMGERLELQVMGQVNHFLALDKATERLVDGNLALLPAVVGEASSALFAAGTLHTGLLGSTGHKLDVGFIVRLDGRTITVRAAVASVAIEVFKCLEVELGK